MYLLCKTFESPIQPASSENLLLENFISWDKSCETGEFFTQFLMWKVCCHRVQKVTVMCRKEDSQGFRSCVNWLVPGGKEMAILSNVKVIFFCVTPYDRHLYINDQ